MVHTTINLDDDLHEWWVARRRYPALSPLVNRLLRQEREREEGVKNGKESNQVSV